MRIISKFKDYYDSVQSEGMDRSMMFFREHQQFQRSPALKDLSPSLSQFVAFAAERTPGRLTLKPKRDCLSVELEFGLVLFAGRLFPYAELQRQPRELGTWSESYFIYTLAELHKVLEEHDYDIAERETRRAHRAAVFGGSSRATKDFFELTKSEELLVTAMTGRLAVVHWARHLGLLNVNPRLADLQFYRQMDAYQCFQELSMFWGNLAAPERAQVVIEDKYRIAQHGFDKWSFRKPPEAA